MQQILFTILPRFSSVQDFTLVGTRAMQQFLILLPRYEGDATDLDSSSHQILTLLPRYEGAATDTDSSSQ